jgi:hypothetical protein
MYMAKCLEEAYNTSNAALRVVEGERKGNAVPQGIIGHSVTSGHNTETWSFRLRRKKRERGA